MADEQIAASSPATIEIPAPAIASTDGWSSSDRQEWLKTGKMPTPAAESKETTPETKANEPSAPEKGGNESASETGKDQEHAKPKAEKRKEQLASEIGELLRQRAILRGEVGNLGAEKAKPAEKPAEQPSSDLKKPRLSDFETVEAYEEATEKYLDGLAEKKSRNAIEQFKREQQEAAQRDEAERQNKELAKSWKARVEEFKKSSGMGDFESAVAPFVDSGAITPNSMMERWILDSEQGPAVLHYFAKNPDEMLRIGELTIIPASREIAKLELQLSGQKPAPASEIKKPIVLPKPPTSLPGRAAPPEDPIEAALASGDVATYRRLKNAQELAVMRK